jgi:hypothetical protein
MGLPVTSFLVMRSLLEAIDLAEDPRREIFQHRLGGSRGLMDPEPERSTDFRGLAAVPMRTGYHRDWRTKACEAVRDSLGVFDLLAFVLHSPMSAVGQTVPPPVELTGFKVYHF